MRSLCKIQCSSSDLLLVFPRMLALNFEAVSKFGKLSHDVFCCLVQLITGFAIAMHDFDVKYNVSAACAVLNETESKGHLPHILECL